MRIGEFGLEIRGSGGLGSSKQERDGYVEMGHGEQYSLWLINDSNERVNLYVKIDGLGVGNFQVGPGTRVPLERPSSGSGRFTFFRSGTSEASSVGEAGVASFDKGLVEVAFIPEIQRPHFGGYVQTAHVTRGGPCGQSASYESCEPTSKGIPTSGKINFAGVAPGVTGMTGHSSQQFSVASAIVEDVSRKVVITLRLVAVDMASLGPVPLPGRRSNPVPSPVG